MSESASHGPPRLGTDFSGDLAVVQRSHCPSTAYHRPLSFEGAMEQLAA
jgi:hypothetical protein